MQIVIRLFLSLALLGASCALHAQERQLYTIALRHTLPEQVLPALQPQLSPGSSLSSFGQQLILKATPAEYRQVNALLEQLDRAPRSLLISVRGQGQTYETHSRYGIDGQAGDGAVRVGTSRDGAWQARTETRVFVNRGSIQGNRDGTQQVRAVEGMAAFISTGGSYPVRSSPYGQRELTPVTSGFYATARLLDNDIVVLDIDQHDDRTAARGGIDTQSLQTQVRGRLGEWIDIGAIDSARGNRSRELSGFGSDSAGALTGISIKVEAAN